MRLNRFKEKVNDFVAETTNSKWMEEQYKISFLGQIDTICSIDNFISQLFFLSFLFILFQKGFSI